VYRKGGDLDKEVEDVDHGESNRRSFSLLLSCTRPEKIGWYFSKFAKHRRSRAELLWTFVGR